MKKTNKTIISIIVGILVLGGLVWIARPSAKDAPPTQTGSNGMLSVEESSNYDFGTISMAAGKVSHLFKIKNTSSETVTIDKMYTSCMCTTATLVAAGKQFGPYGMPGHSAIPTIGQSVSPNEEAIVEVIFDPAAHGPAGVGQIQRVVTIENNAGEPVELQFVAVVTP